MLIVTINEVPGKKLEALGVVRGSTVQSRNLGHDLMAGFRTLVGGEVTDYADMLTEARQIATGRPWCGCSCRDALRFRQRHAGRSRGYCLWNGGEVRMTTKEKQGFGLYFLLAFGLAWLCQVGGCMALLQKQNAVLYQLALVATMLCPLLAVLLVQKVFLRQPTGIGWKVQGKRRYWLAAFALLFGLMLFATYNDWTSPAAGWQRPTAARWTLRPCAGSWAYPTSATCWKQVCSRSRWLRSSICSQLWARKPDGAGI